MRSLLALFAALTLLLPAITFAQDEAALTPIDDRDQAIELLSLFTGEWVARGMARNDFDEELEAAACNMESSFEQASATLINTGRCASTQGAIALDGELTIDEAGELTGGYFQRFEVAELLSSDGRLYEEGFIVEAHYRAELRRRVREVEVKVAVDRPLLRDDGRTVFGMIVSIRDPDTQEFVEFSQLVFTRVE